MKVSETQSNNNQPSPLRKAIGITVGTAIGLSPMGLIAADLLIPMSDKRITNRKKFISRFYSEIDSYETIKKYADDIVTKIKPRTKGLKIETTNPDTIEELFPKQIKLIWPFKNILDNLKKIFANGLNSCYRPDRNVVWSSNIGLYSCVFHEIGHGLNYHSKITKPIVFLHMISQGTLPIFAKVCLGFGIIGVSNKLTQKQNKTKWEKTREFISNNPGKVVFLYSLPIVAEELLASLRGFKLAKNYLTKDQQRLHIRNQAMGLLSYLLLTGAISGAISLGVYTKNKIIKND